MSTFTIKAILVEIIKTSHGRTEPSPSNFGSLQSLYHLQRFLQQKIIVQKCRKPIKIYFHYTCIYSERQMYIKLDTISLRATRRSSVGLAPKIPNYFIHDFGYDIIRFKSSRGINLLLKLITKLLF